MAEAALWPAEPSAAAQTVPAARFAEFIAATTGLLRTRPAEPLALALLRPLLARLVAHDDWLPDAMAAPHPQRYQQYLLHADPQGLFSVVSFVWGPGQATPVHDHTVWGLVGVLRGQEVAQAYRLDARGRLAPHGRPQRMRPGQVEAVSPSFGDGGDIHRVANACDDRVSISIHVYGGDIGRIRRHVYDDDGGLWPFVSGYANVRTPP